MSDPHKAVAVIERAAPAQMERMSPVVQAGLAILERHPNPETLRELLAVQKDYEANEARKAYAAAQVALKRDLPTVIKRDKVVDFTSQRGRTHYTHSSLAEVMRAVTDSLTQHGFSLTFHPATGKGEVSVTCRLTHAQGHFEETTLTAPIDNSGNKSPAQGVASTITLLQRYSALALLGIATADMQEPAGEAEPAPGAAAPGDKVDSKKNLTACAWVVKQGRTREAAEAFLGRPVAEWTASDLAKLKTWAKGAPPTDPDAPPQSYWDAADAASK